MSANPARFLIPAKVVLDALEKYWDDDLTSHWLGMETIHGLPAWRAAMESFFGAFPDAAFTLDDIFFAGDRGVWRGRWQATQQGEWQGIAASGRNEFFLVGGAGSANAMREIQSGSSVLKATVIYPSTQAADGIRLARLVVQGKSLSDIVEVEVPTRIVLNAPVVTADNVDQYLPTAFAS